MTWQTKLLRWYRRHRRDLPWRRTKDPYAIWISEIMLQQTTVEAVIPYYERFLKRFPTVESLAESEEQEVLGLWSGLGYYSRARNLHKAAEMLVGARSSRPGRGNPAPTLPNTVDELMKLPGIGRYTAGAIASIAFEQRAPIVDGNVIRVLSRLYAISEDPKSSKGQKVFWQKAEEVLPPKGERSSRSSPPSTYADFNQALMELGATVCLPEIPKCLLCPVTTSCKVFNQGTQDVYPKGRKRIVYRNIRLTAAVIAKRGKVLLARRKGDGLLGGLWEFPMIEGSLGRLLDAWPVEVVQSLPLVRHSILNKRLQITPVLCRPKRGWSPPRDSRWFDQASLTNLPTSSMNHKIGRIIPTQK